MFTIVDVILEANPNSFDLLRERVHALSLKEDPKIPGTPSFVRLKQISQLHFMSLEIFQDRHFDPLLVFENNFDGDSDSYWQNALEEIGEDLRGIFACTKPALEPRWLSLFEESSTLSLEPFIKEYSVAPSASHIGAVGINLDRIKRDRGVFEALQARLGSSTSQFHGLTAANFQRQIRGWAVPNFPWLNTAEPWSIQREKTSYKYAAIRPILPAFSMVAILISMLAFFCSSDFLPNHGHLRARHILISLAMWLLVGLVLVATSLGICLWTTLRRLEISDMTQDDPRLDLGQLKAFAAQEDQIVQNHVASIVLVKPGVVRSIIIRGSLRVLKMFVPLVATDGYLGSMRTIHFAHWTLVGNAGRLMFLSNFDGSWQSYLDDFVDKAHRGLTLAWGNCVGFPPTKKLIEEGATHGTQFKAWARQSQTQSILWYSAYADLTVNQILRNAAIVDGLRKLDMTDAEAGGWAELL
jgi:hypothetical protein